MEHPYYLSIVIPAFREEERIYLILEAIEKYEKTVDFEIEAIVVVDGSPDDTAGAARKYESRLKHLRVINNTVNKGKGAVVKQGMLEAKGKYILFSDADNSTPVEQVDKLLKYINNYQVIIGSRYCENGKLAIPQSFVRREGSRFLNIFIQMIAVSGIKDTQCGFKLFEGTAAKKIFKLQTFERFSFDIEVLAIAKRLGYNIKEVGITWYDNPHSTVNPIKDGFRMIKDSWQIRKNIFQGLYRPTE